MKCLSEEQREKWAIDGYLHLAGVLSSDEVDFFNAELDRIRQIPGWEPSPDGPLGHYAWLDHALDLDPEGFMDRRDLLPFHPAFIDLMDRPEVFDLIVDIMGPYLLLSMTQAIVRPSDPEFRGYTHTDGGEALRRVRVTETSRPLALKALYLLSDTPEPNMGNFTVSPGSHMRPFPERAKPGKSARPAGAVQLTGKAGDCIVFPHSLWHGPSPNLSGRGEKDHPLQLRSDVRARLRLRDGFRGQGSLHATPTTPARRPGPRVSPRFLLLRSEGSGRGRADRREVGKIVRDATMRRAARRPFCRCSRSSRVGLRPLSGAASAGRSTDR